MYSAALRLSLHQSNRKNCPPSGTKGTRAVPEGSNQYLNFFRVVRGALCSTPFFFGKFSTLNFLFLTFNEPFSNSLFPFLALLPPPPARLPFRQYEKGLLTFSLLAPLSFHLRV